MTSLSPTVEETVKGTVEGTVETSEMRRIRRASLGARAARSSASSRLRDVASASNILASSRAFGGAARVDGRDFERRACPDPRPKRRRRGRAARAASPERPLGARMPIVSARCAVGIRPGLGRRDGGGETPRADGDANGPRIRFRIYPVRQPREVVLLLRGGDLERFGGRRRGDEAAFATRPFERSQHDADRSRRRDWWYDRRRSGGEIGGERGGARDFERCRVGCRTGCLVGCRHSGRRVASASASAVASAPKLDVRFHPRDASCARRRGASAAVRRRADSRESESRSALARTLEVRGEAATQTTKPHRRAGRGVRPTPRRVSTSASPRTPTARVRSSPPFFSVGPVTFLASRRRGRPRRSRARVAWRRRNPRRRRARDASGADARTCVILCDSVVDDSTARATASRTASSARSARGVLLSSFAASLNLRTTSDARARATDRLPPPATRPGSVPLLVLLRVSHLHAV